MADPLLQPSFAGGEIDPALWGRVDLDRYGIGAKLISNWIVRPYGGMETRPGTTLVAEAKYIDRHMLLLPFIVSDTLSYAIELGHYYARFHYDGGTLVDGGGQVVEIATPWSESEIEQIRFTQSADTMFLVHKDHRQRVLRRTGPSTFSLEVWTPREGPFLNLNSNEALLMSASAKTGTVVVTAGGDVFEPNMVGGLLYLEQKALGQIKPWVQGERTRTGGMLQVGSLRKSDGKVYRASTVAPASGQNYTETGNIRPIHEVGREWDGPADVRTFDTINYTVGIEWEYVHSGYGIVEITEYLSATQVRGSVKKVLPDGVVGGIGVAFNTWTHNGTGAATTFPVAGATSFSQANYVVTINNAPLQPDPNYIPPPPTGGGFQGPGTGVRPGGPGFGNIP